MARRSKAGIKLRQGYTSVNLGRLEAEYDSELERYYVQRERYVDRAISLDDQVSFFVGPKGSGKSAILQMVRLSMLDEPGRIINISPTHLSISAFSHVDVASPLLKGSNKKSWLYKSLWHYVIATEVGSREFPDENRLLGMVMKLVQGRDEKQVRKLLKLRFNDKGEQETLAARFMKLVKEVEISGELSSPELGKLEMSTNIKVDPDELARHPQFELLSLVYDVSTKLADTIDGRYYLLIDDLDVDWHNESMQNDILAAMFSTLRRMCRPPHLKCIVSIQDRIFRELPIEHKDKFRDSLCDVEWDHDSVKEMVERRISRVVEITPGKVWDKLFADGGFEFIWKRIAGRPREAIRLASICLEVARRNGHNEVTEDDRNEAFRRFSADRVEDIGNELSHMLPGFGKFLTHFAGFPKEFPLVKINDAVESAILKCMDNSKISYQWIRGYENSYHEIARVMLEHGILLFKRSRTDRPVLFSSNEHDLDNENIYVAFHPMYTAGLGLVGHV